MYLDTKRESRIGNAKQSLYLLQDSRREKLFRVMVCAEISQTSHFYFSSEKNDYKNVFTSKFTHLSRREDAFR